jgi:hypothetical protein
MGSPCRCRCRIRAVCEFSINGQARCVDAAFMRHAVLSDQRSLSGFVDPFSDLVPLRRSPGKQWSTKGWPATSPEAFGVFKCHAMLQPWPPVRGATGTIADPAAWLGSTDRRRLFRPATPWRFAATSKPTLVSNAVGTAWCNTLGTTSKTGLGSWYPAGLMHARTYAPGGFGPALAKQPWPLGLAASADHNLWRGVVVRVAYCGHKNGRCQHGKYRDPTAWIAYCGKDLLSVIAAEEGSESQSACYPEMHSTHCRQKELAAPHSAFDQKCPSSLLPAHRHSSAGPAKRNRPCSTAGKLRHLYAVADIRPFFPDCFATADRADIACGDRPNRGDDASALPASHCGRCRNRSRRASDFVFS